MTDDRRAFLDDQLARVSSAELVNGKGRCPRWCVSFNLTLITDHGEAIFYTGSVGDDHARQLFETIRKYLDTDLGKT